MNKLLILLLFVSTISFAQTEGIIDSGNSKLHYTIFGKGQPILIINGGPGINSDGFASVAKELAAMDQQAILYDQRGTGKSTLALVNSETITMDLMVEDIEHLRNHLKIKKWNILGHSFGGLLAAYYATKHPEFINKLVFSSSGGINLNFTSYVQKRINDNLTKTERDSLNYYQNASNNNENPIANQRLRAKYLAKAYVFNKSNSPQIAERLTQTKFNINALVFEDLRKIKFDCATRFKDFKNPILVIQGKNDIIAIETAKEIANAFPNSKLVLIDNCAHYGWLDAPKKYFDSIKSFLSI